MADLIIKFPSAEDEERAKAFKVQKNYVAAIAAYLDEEYGPTGQLARNLLATQRSMPGYHRVQARTLPDADLTSRYLRISWVSEVQLRLATDGAETELRYSNVWAPIHAYYAVYMSMQAWFAVNNMTHLVEDHTSSLRTISSQIINRRFFPLPWSVSCTGCPQLEGAIFQGVPSGNDPHTHVEVLSNPSAETFWPRYCKMLATTRERRLERNFKEWKKSQHRRKMFAHEKMRVAQNLPATTLLDFFWRLRVRSNYRDVTTFLTWNVSNHDHRAFRDGLITITEATCALLESLIVAAGGRSVYESCSDEFVDSVDRAGFLATRRNTVLGEGNSSAIH